MYRLIVVFLLLGTVATQAVEIKPRVVGGDFAKQSKFPFVASIRNSTNKFLCGGAIVDKYWILTAAECVFQQSTKNVQVVVGTTELDSGGTIYKVDLIKLHPNFINNTKENNLALLKLTSEIDENNNVEKIHLADDTLSDGKDVELAGWGSIRDPSQNVTNSLHWVELKSYPLSDCKKALPNIYYYNICTKGKTTKGACTGDVGSPLIRRGGLFSKTRVHGIVSQYTQCTNGLPDVYVSVYAFKLWIDQEIGN